MNRFVAGCLIFLSHGVVLYSLLQISNEPGVRLVASLGSTAVAFLCHKINLTRDIR